MSPSDFKAWRERLGLSKAEAARQLGLSSRVISYYEDGRKIPQSVINHAIRIEELVKLKGGKLRN